MLPLKEAKSAYESTMLTQLNIKINFGGSNHHHSSERLWKSSRVHAGLQRRRWNSYQFIIHRAEDKWFRTCFMSFSSGPLLKGLQVPSVRCGSSQLIVTSAIRWQCPVVSYRHRSGNLSLVTFLHQTLGFLHNWRYYKLLGNGKSHLMD